MKINGAPGNIQGILTALCRHRTLSNVHMNRRQSSDYAIVRAERKVTFEMLCVERFTDTWAGQERGAKTELALAWISSTSTITQTPVSGSCCLPLGALQSMWAT